MDDREIRDVSESGDGYDRYTDQDTEAGRLTALVLETVLDDLHGRGGIGDELDAIDEEVYAQMRHEMHKAVWTALVTQGGLDPDH